MAHNININEKTGKASVFVTGKPAWHNLGTVLDKPATAEEALELAGLNFEVLTEQVKTASDILIPGSYATVRSDNNVPLGIVGSKYKVVQNKDAFSFFDPIVGRDEAVYHSAGVLGKGEKTWIMAKLPEHIKVGAGDDIEMYVSLMNTHDGSGAIKAFIHPNAIVCENTLKIALGQAKDTVSIRHTVSAKDRLEEAHRVLGIANLLTGELEQVFTQMTKVKISDKDRKKFVNMLFPLPLDYQDQREKGVIKRELANVKHREAVLEAIEVGAGQELATRKGTAFGLWNGVTYWLDHQKTYQSDSNRLESIWTGNSSKIREKAFELAMNFN